MGDRLATTYMGQKVEGDSCALSVWGAGSPSNTMSLGPSLRGLSLYQLTKWHLDPFNHLDNTPTLQTDMTVP